MIGREMEARLRISAVRGSCSEDDNEEAMWLNFGVRMSARRVAAIKEEAANARCIRGARRMRSKMLVRV